MTKMRNIINLGVPVFFFWGGGGGGGGSFTTSP